jgi:hypothetical protein
MFAKVNFILTDLSPPSRDLLRFLFLEFVERNAVNDEEDDGVERSFCFLLKWRMAGDTVRGGRCWVFL